MREISHFLKRTMKRLDVTSRSLIALIEPGSCFAGTLAELAFAADRSAIFVGNRCRRQPLAGCHHLRAQPISGRIAHGRTA